MIEKHIYVIHFPCTGYIKIKFVHKENTTWEKKRLEGTSVNMYA